MSSAAKLHFVDTKSPRIPGPLQREVIRQFLSLKVRAKRFGSSVDVYMSAQIIS